MDGLRPRPATARHSGAAAGFAAQYVVAVAVPMMLSGILLGFAATLDSWVTRWVHFVVTFLMLCAGGLAGRLLSGLLLLGYALVHVVALLVLYRDSPIPPWPFAFAATLGYLALAVGAFIGPRYE